VITTLLSLVIDNFAWAVYILRWFSSSRLAIAVRCRYEVATVMVYCLVALLGVNSVRLARFITSMVLHKQLQKPFTEIHICFLVIQKILLNP
jgi:hypothetical protein